MDYDKLAKGLGGSAASQETDLDKLATELGGSLFKPSFGQQLLAGEGPDIKQPKKTGSVLEGTTLTPAEQAAPATGPSLEEVAGQIKQRIPEEELNAAKLADLAEKTRQYEEEVPFLQRQTDPLQSGIARIPGILPGLDVASTQKEINKIRQGQSGVRDPISGEIIPFSPEEAEAAIKSLQERQAIAQKKVMESQAEAGKYRKRPAVEAIGNVKTARQAFDAFQVDPFGVMASVSLESAPQMVPALVLGAVTRNPTVGALAMGSTSFATELSSGVTEYFQDKGININDPVAVNKALNDPVMFAKAYEHALTRASIIGTLDTASAGLASKMLVPKSVVKGQVAREAVNIGVAQPTAQMISGGGGEALAQIATEGSITKPGQVLLEAAGEGPTSILETAAFGGEKAVERLRGQQPDPTLTDVRVPPPIPEGMDPELHARASMKLDAIISQADQSGTVNKRELNKLARDLGITPSKDANDTVSTVYNTLYPEVAPEAPAVEAEAPVAEQALPPEVEQEIAAAEAETPPENKPFFDEIRGELQQKTQALRDSFAKLRQPKEAIPEEEPTVPTTVKSFDEAEFEAPQEAPVVPQATEVVEEEAPVEAPKTQAQINQERQAAQREAAAVAKPSKEDVAEKKMLDAIEAIKKTKGTANQFIAKYGKPMFDRANAEGYIENEANDQRLFSTLKLDELWSKYNKPEEYAEMMKRREAGEKERQAEQAKIAEEAKPAYTPPKLRTDNPGGGWLKNKREQSIEDGKKKSGVPIRFGSVTGYFREGNDVRKPLIPVEVLARLQGMNDEQNNVRQKDLEAIKKIMDETGRLPPAPDGEDYVPFINVYQDGTAYVNEGNHRIMAAKALGFKYLPVEISYFNGAEQVEDGDLSPKNIISYDMQANDDGLSKENYRGEAKPAEAPREMDKLKRDMVTEAYPFAKPEEEAPAKAEVKVSENKIFTEDAATKARNRLRSKLNQLNSGIDPEFLIDGITLSGYHIEKGARTFAAYSKAMIADLGDKVKPYLKQWYNAVRDDPSAESLVDSMDTYEQVKNASLPSEVEGMDLMDPEDKFDIAKLMSATMTGPNPNEYKTIVEARAFISKLTGKKIESGTAEAKEADEAIETAVILAARDIIELNRKNGNDFRTYDDLVALYERQPNLSVRTSTSIKEQAYSTPAPLAYVASRLAGITEKTSVYEPTAGNGMLLIAANPKKVIANELNATRYEMLERVLDGATVNNENAVDLDIANEFDAIIANPPFGVVKNRAGETISYDVDGLKTNEIDHAIAFKALNNMKEEGRAVLIVGGVLGDSNEKRTEGYRSKSKREFYYNLYNKYNVVDHFTVAGDMYKKQGAAYPVDIIVIDGKGKSDRKLPAADLPKVISSYEQLKEKLNEPSLVSKGDVSPTRVDSGDAATGRSERQGLDRGTVGQGIRPSDAGERSTKGGTTGLPSTGVATSGRGEPAGGLRGEGELKPENKPKLPEDKGPVSSEPKRIEPRGVASDQANKPSAVGGSGEVSSKRVEPGLTDRRGQEQETSTQVAYSPHSKASAVGTLAPNAMAKAIDESLTYLEDQVGDIDEYVAKKLDFDVEELKIKFSAEQVDALALAISNAEQGKGFIIGDQTGVGKGRVVAGMIKYALLQGQIPIFMTQKANLYSDMIRDLDDIGMTDVLNLDSNTPNILITQADEKIPFKLSRQDKNGNPIEEKYTLQNPVSQEKHNAFMKQLVKDNDLGKFKVIFSAYDSMNTHRGNKTERAKMVEHFANNNYLILDESHAAGGSGNDPEAQNRANFIRSLVNNSKGSFFSSATYAKRPDVMDLYSTTDMKLAVEDISELGEAIKRGGVPMQQVVANMLTKSGQYIRRERTFAGVAYDTKENKVNKPTAENMATAMRYILDFSNKKKGAVKELKKELDEMGAVGGERDSKTEIKQVHFGSTMHNLIDQMLLSLKTAESVDFAIERLKAGEKVVLTVANTMGSFMKDFAADNNLEKGDEINLSFSDMFLRYLEKQRQITIKFPDKTIQKRRLTDEELGPTLVELYNSIEDYIKNAGFGAAPVSPIDYMHNALRQAGYKTDEITGRELIIDYSGGTPILQGRKADIAQRVNAVDGFNNGNTDVIILNQAGSTGLSLHASSKFKNQQKRHMIIVQPEKNIDTHMQMLGRVHRTGQILAPAYSQMMADIPAEMRPAAVLMKKMASLNANTTASRKSSVTAEGVVDFMNDYGGQVVQEYLRDNPEVHEATGKNVTLKEDSTEGTVEDIATFTGYLPILPIAEQEEVYRDITERYNELLERENSLGTNKLEAKDVDLQAETLSVQPITEDKGGRSLFAAPAVMEKVEVNRTVKPYSSAEVKEQVEKALDGKSKSDVAVEQGASLLERFRDFATKQIDKAKESNADEVKIQSLKDNLRTMHSKIKVILDTYKIGDEISIKDANGIYNYAVITDITNSKKTANPAAGSDWKMHIALANGDAKALTISFSQINTTYTLAQEYYVDYFNPETQQGERVKVMDIFDKGATVRREKRWMVTGNILAGFAKYPGQIVTYTKNDGSVGQGVLMSRQFDFEKAQKEAPVRVKSVDQAMRFFDEIGGVIGTDDNNMRMEKSGTKYYFITPKTKRQGGKYYLDDRLTQFTGTFNSSGNSMRAVIYDRDKAEQAIQHLLSTDNKLLIKTGIERARAMFAPPKLENIEEKMLSKMAVEDRKETIKEYSKTRRSKGRLVKQVAKYGSDIAMQRQLNEMLAHEENLKSYIDSTKIPDMSAEAFMAAATDALRDGRITPEVERFVRSVFEQYPSILNGIKLSVRKKEGKGETTGNFDPITRLVSLWTNTSGVRTSKTVRHELAHTMEQMMTPEAKKAVVGAWARNLESAMKRLKDKDSQKYFEAVLKFLENPTEETARDATNIMPDYSYYQYLNPSEYWAVNAEKLFGQQLGGAWTRFVKAMEKMFEALKAMFFMNNKLAVHRAFDQIIKKQPTRETRDSLMEYLMGAKIPTRLLNQIEEDKNLVDDLGIPDVPNRDSQTMKDYVLTRLSTMNDKAKEIKADPKTSLQEGLHDAFDIATKQRIENIDYTAGLAKRDAARWKGQIRTANGEMVPIIAALNNLRSGHLANAVLVHGKLEYSGKYGQFIAVDSEESMGNVIRLQERLRRRLTKPVADKLINGWFIAKRTRSIQEEYFERTAEVRKLQEQLIANTDATKAPDIEAALADAMQDLANIKLAYQKVPYYFTVYNGFVTKKINGEEVKVPDVQYDQDGLPLLDDSALDSIIARSKAHPELQQMMDNWTAVNHNMLDNLAFSGRESKPRAEKLKKIKDYSPWYRVMDESEDIYDAKKISGASSGPKNFKAGRTERDVDNVVESMMHNVAMFTRSTLKNYAQYRIAMEYAQRRPDTVDPKTGKVKRGRIMVFPGEPRTDAEGAKVPIYIGGRRMIVNIPDTLVADAYIGMSIAPWEYPFREVMSGAAQLSRRTITFSGVFQLKQVFYDSWSAALKSGSKHPWRLFGATFPGFFKALEIGKQNTTVQILKRAAIGGFRSHHRTPDLELKVELGILTNDNWQILMSSIDAIGDASDYSTRIATYDRILKESGDPALALFMSSQIMDFGKHGKGNIGQTMRETVTFMQAWATDLDTLTQTAMGGTITGKEKKKLKAQFNKTMLQFMILAIAYTLLAALDPDYDELDDATKARNFYVPFSKKATGKHVLIPLNNSAAFFFKVTPEMIINYARKYGTEKEIDTTRAVDAWLKAFVDSILGPTPIPTGAKPTLEIFLDRNFFTGGTVVPKSLADMESSEQYNATTSELAKIFGEYTGISPVKTDHFIRGTFGTMGALAQWFSNAVFSEGRVASELKQNPIVGTFVAPEVMKLNEQLYYDLKDKTIEAYKTWNTLMEDEKFEKADKYYEKNEKLIEAHGYILSLDEELKGINKEIRRLGRTFDKSMSSEERRKEINDLTRMKQEMLDGIFEVRKDAGL